MKCPYCNTEETKVTDKRDSHGNIRRRRECLKCGERFSTYERIELDLNVIKKDGTREKFNRDKLIKGLEKAFEKRTLSTEKFDNLASEIESKIYKSSKNREINSSKIGQIVMDKIKKTDKIAYIRFASVYREFADIDDFKQELKNLK